MNVCKVMVFIVLKFSTMSKMTEGNYDCGCLDVLLMGQQYLDE